MDLRSFCEHFYATVFLPVSWWQNGEYEGCCGLPDEVQIPEWIVEHLAMQPYFPSMYTAEDNSMYVLILHPEDNGFIVAGPAFSSPATEDTIRSFMRIAAASHDYYDELSSMLSLSPVITYSRFLNILTFIHMMINGEELSVAEHFAIADPAIEDEIAARAHISSVKTREASIRHGTYYYEQMILQHIRNGDPAGMRRFLSELAKSDPLVEGQLADNPLRQARDVFIGLVTIAGKSAAIPGGLDVEQTYQLIDTYIQECEKTGSIDAIKNMQFNMLMDLAARVAKARLPEGITLETYSCMQFISEHITDNVTVDAVAGYIKRSRAYTTSRFRNETGMSIMEYLTQCRMREARLLLDYSSMSIAAISDYLNYADQSHFQKVFKRYYGCTPRQYRLQHPEVIDD